MIQKCLLLDEPTSGLDPDQLFGIRELLKSFARERTVLLSTHLLSEVEACCSKVVIMNAGSVVLEEPIANFAGKGLENVYRETVAQVGGGYQ